MILHLGQRAGIHTNEQFTEIILQLLTLLGFGLTPLRTHGKAGHHREVNVRHDEFIHQLLDSGNVTIAQCRLALDAVKHLITHRQHPLVGVFLCCGKRPHRQRAKNGCSACSFHHLTSVHFSYSLFHAPITLIHHRRAAEASVLSVPLPRSDGSRRKCSCCADGGRHHARHCIHRPC